MLVVAAVEVQNTQDEERVRDAGRCLLDLAPGIAGLSVEFSALVKVPRFLGHLLAIAVVDMGLTLGVVPSLMAVAVAAAVAVVVEVAAAAAAVAVAVAVERDHCSHS